MWLKLLTAMKGSGHKYFGPQSPNLPGTAARLGRFLYEFSLGWIAVSWYSGYVNMHTSPGSGPKLILPGAKLSGDPPDRPNRSPKFSGGGGNSSNGTNAYTPPSNLSGARQAIMSAAHSALGYKSGYSERRPYPHSLAACAKTPTDCSGYVTLVYKQAKQPDPNGLGYNGQGYTGTLITHGRPTGNPQPGDLVFWSNPDHVGIYVGNNAVIEWGAPPGPQVVPIPDETKLHGAFLGYRTYVR